MEPPSAAEAPFNSSAAEAFLAFNAASQCPNKDITSWNCTACPVAASLQEVNITEAGGHLAYVAYDAAAARIVVVLRGSLSIQDWLENFHYWKVSAYQSSGCIDCHVHRGFLYSFQALQPGIEASVDALLARHPGAPIAITGHSLGAAMAAHAAVALGHTRKLRLSLPVYTFGQPRVGDAAFASWFESVLPSSPGAPSWFRVVHWNDPVPHLAPASLGVRHMGREVWYDEPSDAAMVCDGSGEDPNCSASIVTALIFADHCSYLGHNNCQCQPF